MLRVNKQIYLEFIEAWRTSVYIVFKGYVPAKTRSAPKVPLPVRPKISFKGLIVRCHGRSDDRDRLKRYISLALKFKAEAFYLLYTPTNPWDEFINHRCAQTWETIIPKVWRPHIARRVLKALREGRLQRVVLQITPYENCTSPEALQGWKKLYLMNDSSVVDSEDLSIAVAPIALPGPVAERKSDLRCPTCVELWSDTAEFMGLTVSKA